MKTPSRTLATFILCALMALLAMALLGGCKHTRPDERPGQQLVIPPSSPDLPAIQNEITNAKASSGRASASAKRADMAAASIIAANAAQEAQIKQLRLELATTIEDLRLVEESLDRSLAQIERLKVDVAKLTDWGIAWQSAAHTAQEQEDNARLLAQAHEKAARKAGRERDVFVLLFAIILAVFATVQAAPYLARLQPPWLAIAAYVAVPTVTFLASYLGIRFTLDRIVALTIF